VRVEGDTDANLLYTDASTDRIGVGTATPSTKLDVNGSFNVAGAATISPANAAVAISPTGTGTVAISPGSTVTISPTGALTVNPTAASTINNTSIGATTASTGRFSDLTDTGLTSGRVIYAGTGGNLVDSANLTFNGTNLSAPVFRSQVINTGTVLASGTKAIFKTGSYGTYFTGILTIAAQNASPRVQTYMVGVVGHGTTSGTLTPLATDQYNSTSSVFTLSESTLDGVNTLTITNTSAITVDNYEVALIVMSGTANLA
jgi:hypothetical protein